MYVLTGPLTTTETALPRVPRTKRDLLPLAVILVGLVFLGSLGYAQRERFLTGRNDFLQLYAGARLSGTPGLYNPAANKAVSVQAVGTWLQSVYYSRPPFYALILRPLGRLPYNAAYWIFETLSALALIAFLRMWTPRCRELPLFASLCLPLLAVLLDGQDLTFVLLASALAVEAMRRKRDFSSGLLWSLCAIKIHLFVLVPIALLVHRRWGVLKGLAAGGLGLLAVSFISDGLVWPSRYLALLANPELHPSPGNMPTIRGLVYAFSGTEAPWAEAALSIAVLLLVIRIAQRSGVEIALAFALAGGLLVGYHAYLQDCAVLLVVFVLVLEHSKWPPLRAAMALAVTPPLFLLLAAGSPWNAAVPLAMLLLLALAALGPVRRPAVGALGIA